MKNMISTIRHRVAESGTATISIDEFNQLQAEWIKRTVPDEIVEALKMAFCYMPNFDEITEELYRENTVEIKKEREFVSQVLSELGLEPESLYDEMHPRT